MGNAQIASFHFSTTGVDSPFDAWQSLLNVLFDSLPPKTSPARAFEANLKVFHFDTFLLCRSVAVGGRYRRTAERLARDDLDHIVISCLLRGGIALPSPAARRLRAGDVAVLDLSAPTAFAMSAADGMHLIMPRTLLPAAMAPVQPMTGRILAQDSAMAIFIRGILEALSEAAMRLSPGEVIALGSSVPDLLASCLGPPGEPPSAGARGDLGRRLRRHIEENLHRSDLTPSRLTHDLRVSRSQLYRQFESSGGVEAYIRRRRLRRCLLTLCDSRHADRRIGDIAYEMGFPDEAHFSRLFRRAFGVSPRGARAGVRQDGIDLGGLFRPSADVASFGDWLTALYTN
ncbi:helix-turn-helix domain-containing protein [Ensifer adhaerens]|uniref:helix-turn-helix domain-containing protein n=1 Tax=Ensifer adhaerens TaxID=106592 RepID=UPI003D03F6EA